MNLRKKKHGFTIVELVIVIAVIGVLSAILIPTFAGLINKAKLSSDQHAVSQMNTALIADEVVSGKPETYEDMAKVLREAGFNVPSDTVSEGYLFVWDSELNRVFLYNGKTEKPEHPGDIVAELKDINGFELNRWFSLANKNEEPPITPEVKYTPKIKIVPHALGGYTLALDETSIQEADWDRYEIVLKLHFRLAEYKTTSGDGFTEVEFLNPYGTQRGYYNPSQVSDLYTANFSTSVSKDGNVAVVPYMQLFAIGRDMAKYHLDEKESQPIALDVTTPEGIVVHIDSVGVAVWGTTESGSYYNSGYHALEDIDIVNGLMGDGSSDQYLILQSADEVPSYTINLYDKSDNLIGTNTYLPPVSEVKDALADYVADYETWLNESGKENTRETLIEYHNLGNKFTSSQLVIEDLVKTFGIGDTGSEIIESVVLSCLEARPSTFGRYTIVIKASEPDTNGNYKYIFEYTELK